jgi:2-phosphoglycerate kinase
MKKNYSQAILLISILSITIAFLWIYLSVHLALKKTEKPTLTQEEIKVLNPDLDESVFEELAKRYH